IDFWVQDVNGNWDYVATTISVQDNMGACGNVPGIYGAIETEYAEPVEGAEVVLSGGSGTLPPPVLTNAQGFYEFPPVTSSDNFVVTPGKNDGIRDGVTVLDLLLLSRHLVGLETLDSPYKLIAADVDHNERLNTFDIIEMQRLLLYLTNEFPNNTSWRFVDVDYLFPNPANPWLSTFPEVIAINGLDGGNSAANFVGIKVGDLTEDALSNANGVSGDRSFADHLQWKLQEQWLEAGKTYRVEFRASDFERIAAYQFGLHFDPAVLALVDLLPGESGVVNAEHFGLSMIDEGVITAAWTSPNPQMGSTLGEDEVVFSLLLRAQRPARLSEVLTLSPRYAIAQAFDVDLQGFALGLTYESEAIRPELLLYQNQPNPFVEETIIGFELPEAGEATVSIYDVSGKVLKVIRGSYAKGYNQLGLSRSDLSTTGVLYYELRVGDQTLTKKMILME
ncbi:MAG: T9SS type A sorting domain-containing protein, partial [Bacteroidota bacterium]